MQRQISLGYMTLVFNVARSRLRYEGGFVDQTYGSKGSTMEHSSVYEKF